MDPSLPGSSVHGESPGKNTEVSCCALLQRIFPTQGLNPGLPCCRQILYQLGYEGNTIIYVSESERCSVLSYSFRPHRLYSPWNSPGQNTGVDSCSFLQGIFPTQGSNPGLPHCRQILYQLSHQGSPEILEWVAYPFSRGSSRPRNRTGISCIAGRSFTS